MLVNLNLGKLRVVGKRLARVSSGTASQFFCLISPINLCGRRRTLCNRNKCKLPPHEERLFLGKAFLEFFVKFGPTPRSFLHVESVNVYPKFDKDLLEISGVYSILMQKECRRRHRVTLTAK